MNSDICIGYLDTQDRVDFPSVSEKMMQLTKLHVTRLYQAVPNFTASDVNDILRWFKKQDQSRYLVILTPGTLLNTRETVSRAIEQLASCKAMVKGELKHRQGFWYLHDYFVVVDRYMFELLMEPGWGHEGQATVRTNANIHVTPDFQYRLQAQNGMNATTAHAGGWGFIEFCMRWQCPVLNLDNEDHKELTILEPEIGTDHFSKALTHFSPNGVWVKKIAQHGYLLKHSVSTTRIGRAIDIFDHDERSIIGPKTELKQLISLASGFRPLQIMAQHGFRADARVVYFDICGAALDFRRTMLESWDGVDYLGFVRKCERRTGYLINYVSDEEQAWRDVQASFGGAREFKVMWDTYRQLHHTFLKIDLIHQNKMLADLIQANPRSYMWFSDVFCTDEAHLLSDSGALTDGYMKFRENMRYACPQMIMDGRDPLGRFA